MIFPKLLRFAPLAFLLLRLMVGIVFIDSGWRDLHAPKALGIWPQFAALGLALVT